MDDILTEIIDDLKCPLTGLIFKNPVIASDNIVYEANELAKFIIKKKNNISPKTGHKITKIIKIIALKNTINDLVATYPYLEKYRYTEEISNDSESLLKNYY